MARAQPPKGGLRHGHESKKGGGGLRNWHNSEGGGGGLKNWSCQKGILITDVAQKVVLWSIFIIYLFLSILSTGGGFL